MAGVWRINIEPDFAWKHSIFQTLQISLHSQQHCSNPVKLSKARRSINLDSLLSDDYLN
jgi:hypothetical protein